MSKRLTYKQLFNKKHGFDLNEPHDLKEIARLSGYEYKGIKTIFERGEGAYYNNPESVRKSVKNPQQWAYARVYAAVHPKSKAHKVDKMFLIKTKKKS
tara:strand:- start:1095 stop:1388 length:294 start_codon:yes stop_codon:yes gene_type:complete